jgi:hypothetical protein
MCSRDPKTYTILDHSASFVILGMEIDLSKKVKIGKIRQKWVKICLFGRQKVEKKKTRKVQLHLIGRQNFLGDRREVLFCFDDS